ncbi:unnamed protein product [Owenia fusiformis]|uniref:Uncharacterized protein n=1 Tax=Owenia fusiformis TaxID=6347 RepID=A0A8S4MZV8_OWEFU|nr:unnamed protein product [Owenia fusiformis]
MELSTRCKWPVALCWLYLVMAAQVHGTQYDIWSCDINPLVTTCFNDSFAMSTSSSVEWTLGKRGTPSSGTGPQSAATYADGMVFLEASGGQEQSATLTMSAPTATTPQPMSAYDQGCHIGFTYHCYSAKDVHYNRDKDFGRLEVTVGAGSPVIFCNDYTDLDLNWQQGSVSYTPGSGSNVVFEGFTGQGFEGDVCINNVRLYCEDSVVTTTLGPTTTTTAPVTTTIPAPTGWSAWSEICKDASGNVLDCGVQGFGTYNQVCETSTCTKATTQYVLNDIFEEYRGTTCWGKCTSAGQWNAWGNFGACSTTCGSGTYWRYRTCARTSSQSACVGYDTESQNCNTDACPPAPAGCSYNGWSSWSTCSATCGPGTRTATRTDPKDLINCVETRNEACTVQACWQHGGWNDWGLWTGTCVTCGTPNTLTRQRACDNPVPIGTGRYCLGSSEEVQNCPYMGQCPVDGAFGNWMAWSTCRSPTKDTCGSGTQVRYRVCNNPQPKYGGNPCTGVIMETQACDLGVCNTKCQNEADILLIVDTSGSINDQEWADQCNMIYDFIGALDVDSGRIRVAVEVFSRTVKTSWDFDDHDGDSAAMLDKIANSCQGLEREKSTTNHAGAQRHAISNLWGQTSKGDRLNVVNVEFMLTDGCSTLNADQTVIASDETHASPENITVIVAAVGEDLTTNQTCMDMMINMATGADPYALGTLVETTDFVDLTNKVDELVTKTCLLASACNLLDPPCGDLTLHSCTPKDPASLMDFQCTCGGGAWGTTCSGCSAPKEIQFVIDNSYYVSPTEFTTIKDTVKAVIQEFDVDTNPVKVGVMFYSDSVYHAFKPSDGLDSTSMLAAIDASAYASGAPNAYKAFQELPAAFTDPSAPDVVLYFSKTVNHEKPALTQSLAKDLKDSGVHIFGINIGLTPPKDDEMKFLVTESYLDNLFYVNDYQRLLDQVNIELFRDIACQANNFCYKGCKNSGVCLNSPTGYKCDCPAGFWGPDCNGCDAKADVVMVVDHSSSIGDANFALMRTFLSDLATRFAASGPGHVQLAVVDFSDTAAVHGNLDLNADPATVAGIVGDAAQYPYLTGMTNTADALMVGREVIQDGKRAGVPSVLLLITDGESNMNEKRTLIEAQTNQYEGITTKVVQIGGGASLDAESIAIASPPSAVNVFKVADFAGLATPDLFTDISQATCDPIDMCSSSPCPSGTCIDMIGNYVCKPDTQFCDAKLDIVFGIDVSNMDSATMSDVATFVDNFFSKFYVTASKVNVGLFNYQASGSQTIMLKLSDGTSLSAVSAELGSMTLPGTTTDSDSGDAINFAHNTMFTSGNGDRTDATNLLILISDTPTVDFNQAVLNAESAKYGGVHIKAVGFGSKYLALNNQLQKIVSTQPTIADNLWAVDTVSNLDDGLATYIAESSCDKDSQCTQDNGNSVQCPNGGTCIDGIFGFLCQCPSGTSGPNCLGCKAELDIYVLLDDVTSGFEAEKNLLLELVDRLDVTGGAVKMGLAVFGNTVAEQWKLSAYSTNADLKTAISALVYGGQTAANTNLALDLALSTAFTPASGNRDGVPDLILLVTGNSASLVPATISAAQYIQTSGIDIAAIGFASAPQAELQQIASEPSSRFALLAANTAELESALFADQVIQNICDPDDQCDSSPCGGQSVCKDGVFGFTCSCIPPAMGTQCDISCDTLSDIVFIVDSSASVTEANFNMVRSYVADLVGQFDIGNRHQVGVIRVADGAKYSAHLNTYTTASALESQVNRMTFSNSVNTNLAAGLNSLVSINGARANARKFAIILSDGYDDSANVNSLAAVEAKKATADGWHIMVVRMHSGITQQDAENVASIPYRDFVVKHEDYNTLETLTPILLEGPCEDQDQCITLKTATTNPCGTNGVCTDGINGVICSCPPGFVGPNCDDGMICNGEVDIMFAFDYAAGISKSDYEKYFDFVYGVTENVDINNDLVRVGIVNYRGANVVTTVVDATAFVSDKQGLLKEINSKKVNSYGSTSGPTNSIAAVEAATTFFAANSRAGVAKLLCIITDGETSATYWNSQSISSAKQNDITIMSFGVGSAVNTMKLSILASDPKDNEFSSGDYNNVTNNIASFSDRVCQDPDDCVRSDGSPSCGNGGTCTDKFNTMTCDCPAGFSGPNCLRECSGEADILFILDANSVRDRIEIVDYIKCVVDEVALSDTASGKTGHQIALIAYGVKASDPVLLLDYSENNIDIKSKAEDLLLLTPGTQSDIEKAFTLAQTTINGSPRAVSKVVFLLMDSVESNGKDTDAMQTLSTTMFYDNYHFVYVVNTQTTVDAAVSDQALAIATPLPSGEATSFELEGNMGLVNWTSHHICGDKNDCDGNACQNGGTCRDLWMHYSCDCPPNTNQPHCDASPPDGCQIVIDLIYLVDESSSVPWGPNNAVNPAPVTENFEFIKQFINTLNAELPITSGNTQVALTRFSTVGRALSKLNAFTTNQAVEDYVSSLKLSGGGTNTFDGYVKVQSDVMVDAAGYRKSTGVDCVLIMVTDGASKVPGHVDEAQKIRIAGCLIITIGVFLQTDAERTEIKMQASDPSTDFYDVAYWDGLPAIALEILKRFCGDPDPCDPSPCLNSGVCTAKSGAAFCSCQTGFVGQHCEIAGSVSANVVVMLDGSSSVSGADFVLQTQYVSELIERMDTLSDVSLGMMMYDNAVNVIATVGQYTTKLENQAVVGTVVQKAAQGGKLAEALNYIPANNIFPSNGKQNLLILLTSDTSVSTADFTAITTAATAVMDSGVSIMTIAVGPQSPSGQNFLNLITTNPAKQLFEKTSWSEIPDVYSAASHVLIEAETTCPATTTYVCNLRATEQN